MARTTDELVEIAKAHAAAEARGDFAATMSTLDEDPVYELLPVGLVFRGRDVAERYYRHFFEHVQPMVVGYELRNEWVNDRGLGQEYVIDFRSPDGGTERHHVLGILTFGVTALSGERLYASDRAFELMFGPILALAHPLP